MKSNELSFHIARNDGLEFVFSSGHALTYPMHTHESVYTVTLVRKGGVLLTRGRTPRRAARGETGNATEALQAGSVYIVVPHEPHSPSYSDTFDIVSLCVAKSGPQELSATDMMERFMRHARNFAASGLLGPGDIGALADGMARVISEAGHAPPGERHMAGAASLVLPGSGSAPGSESVGPSGYDPGSAGISPDPYRRIRLFKKTVGLTPHRFAVQNRIRAAKTFLGAAVPIAEAALRAGFYDQSHLTRWFHKTIGITPREYARACRFLD